MYFNYRRHLEISQGQVFRRPWSANISENALSMSDRQFIKTYRLSKGLVNNLLGDLEPLMDEPLRSDGLDPLAKILVSLSFLATGSYQTLVGQNRDHTVSQPTVSRSLRAVLDAINKPEFMAKYIKFPIARQEREEIKAEFYASYQLPDVIGCIDGTHIAVIHPMIHEERYFNRKGYHSLNTMIISDANLRIMCVDPSYPGSTHDSRVWLHHPLKTYLENLHDSGENVHLLGDSGYPLRPTMLTPTTAATPRSAEEHFYYLHVSARQVVERCIGVLKGRFRCLLAARELHYDLTTAAKITNACCVLHNIAHGARLPVVPLTAEEAAEDRSLQARIRAPRDVLGLGGARGHRAPHSLVGGRLVRQAVVERVWRERR